MVYIYALRQGKKVVYVGQSNNVKRRVSQHKQDKVFDNHKIIEVCEDKKTASRTEDFYIMKYDPFYNKMLNSHGQYFTLKEIAKSINVKPKRMKIWLNYFNSVPKFSNKFVYSDIRKALFKAEMYESPEKEYEIHIQSLKENLPKELFEKIMEGGI